MKDDPKILSGFFKNQHQKFMRRAYSILQGSFGRCEFKSLHGEWLKRKGGDSSQEPGAPPGPEHRNPPRD